MKPEILTILDDEAPTLLALAFLDHPVLELHLLPDGNAEWRDEYGRVWLGVRLVDRLDPVPKLDHEDRVTPRLTLVTGTWEAVCGWCMKRSRQVRTYAEREAWLEIASTEGWAIWQPPPLGDDPPPPAYPICLVCAEHYATTGEMLSPNTRRRKHRA